MGASGASLGNKLEAREFFKQLFVEVGAFANEDQDVGVFKANRQLPQTFDGVGVDLGVVGVEFGGAI